MKYAFKRPNVWIALLLLLANGAAWAYALAPAGPAVKVEARLEADVAALRQQLIEGGHGGETFGLEITDQEAAETIAWYLARHPNVPFANPQVSIRPTGIIATGVTEIAGLRVGINGQAHIELRNSIPVVTLAGLDVAGVGIPRFVRERIQAEIDAQFSLAQNLPLVFEDIRLEEGRAVVRGTIN